MKTHPLSLFNKGLLANTLHPAKGAHPSFDQRQIFSKSLWNQLKNRQLAYKN